MIEFGAPLWLLGLLALPWLRRLHRSGAPRTLRDVASLEPWPATPVEATGGAPQPPPDPAWRRRAAILALLLLAAAAPRLPTGSPPLTVWIDDTPSLGVVVDGRSRFERLQSQLAAALDERPAGQGPPEVRRFTELPDPRALDPQRTHWLLSDGSRAATSGWLREAPIARVISIADEAGNAGILQLAARATLRDPTRRRVLLAVGEGGGGASSAARRVELLVDGRAQSAYPLALAPLGLQVLEFDVPATASRLVARLQPGDALATDDELELSLAALLPRRVALSAACPAALRALLETHPALELSTTGSGPPALAIDCGSPSAPQAPGIEVPRLRFQTDRVAPGDAAPLQWSGAIDPGQLAGAAALAAPRLSGALDPGPGERVLARSAGAPALTLREGPPRELRAALDPQRLARTQADAALWLAWLLEQATGAEQLGAIASASRTAEAILVAPRALPARGAAAAGASPRSTPALLRPLLVLASLLLAFELALQLRRLVRGRRR